MRAKITQVSIDDNQVSRVEFDTEFGKCRALWMGKKPVLGNVYEVEIEINAILKWGVDILYFGNKVFQIDVNENEVFLVGILDSFDGNIVTLKFGNDFILIETKGTSFKEGNFVKVITKEILIYDINI